MAATTFFRVSYNKTGTQLTNVCDSILVSSDDIQGGKITYYDENYKKLTGKRFKDLYASIFNETGFLIDILRYYDGEENNVTISFEGEEVKSITVETIIKFKKLFCSDEFKFRDFVKRKHKRDLVEIEKWLNNQDSKVV